MANTGKKARGGKAAKASRSAGSARSKGKDAIMVLKEDHERVRQLLGRLERTTERAADNRRKILDQVERELKIHTRLEEEIFYPMYLDSVAKKDDRAMYFEAKEEHRIVDTLIPDLKIADPESEEFAGKAHALKEVVEHHIKEEEREMFSRIKRVASREDLLAIGTELQSRRRELVAEGREAMEDAGETSARAEASAGMRMRQESFGEAGDSVDSSGVGEEPDEEERGRI